MKDAVKRLNDEYRFNLSEQEIELVAKQAEDAARLFQPLLEADLADIAPLARIDRRAKKIAAITKRKK
jgi:hypothetical protein